MTVHNEPGAPRFSTLVDLLGQRAEAQGDALLYRFLETGDVDGPSETWSYQRLDARARSLGARLRALGAQGERALLLYPPGMEFIAGFMGCLYGGVIAVPCYPPDPTRLDRTLPRLRAIAQDCGARYVLTTGTILEMAEFLTPQAPELGALTWLASDAVPEAEAADWKRPDLTADTLAFLQYTSGSTGNPKGVKVSHANILHNESLITRDFGLDATRSIGVGWLPMFHDMGLIGKVLQPLYLGFPCTLMSPIAFLQRPLRWLEAISRFGGTCSGGPNFAYDLCVRKAKDADLSGLDLRTWDLAFNGAEPVRRETMERFAQVFCPHGFRREAFYPCYGLAETTLIVTGGTKGEAYAHGHYDARTLERGQAVPVAPEAAEGPAARMLVSSGRGAPDQRLLIVHPETLTPCAPHEVGEIWVAGPSVAGGYWNRPEETAHAFGARLASGEGPFLRTGDLAFLTPEGELFVTGRLKDLLIIRGRNLYPQDLELTVERAHRAVRAGCTATFAVDVEGEERLVVATEVDVREGFDAAAVVDALRRALADEHAVHAHAVVLLQARSIPKTSSGKIQRRATRAAYLAGELEVVESSVVAGEHVATPATTPTGPFRERLATTSEAERPALVESFVLDEVARVLRVPPTSLARDTSLASLGLDSLMALDLHGRLESELGVPLPAAFLWQHPTLPAAAAHLLEAWNGVRPASALAAPPLVAGPLDGELPLSSGQLRLWFLDRLVPESPLYNVHFQLRLSGPLDVSALRGALDALVARHAVLRATFPEAEGQPRQVLSAARPLDVPRVDLRALSPAEREAELHRLSKAQGEEPFRLAEGPLFRAALVALEDTEHVLLMTQHHIVTDGWSVGVLARELAALYRAGVAGLPATLPPPATQYVDFARWERALGPLLDGQRAYWGRKLEGLSRLELPTDFPRPREPGFRGALHRFTLPLALREDLKALGRREGCTFFLTLAAAWTALLHRYSGQEDFGLGTVIAHRDRPEVRDVAGFFASTLVLRSDVSGAPTFRELLARTRHTFHEALAHSDLPFEEVVGVSRVARGADNPLFQVNLLLESLPPVDLDVPGMRWHPVLPVPDGAVEGTAKFDLQLAVVETPEGLSGALEYRTDLFAPATVARLAGHLEALLRGVVASPEARVEDLPLLGEAERHALLADWNDFTPPAPVDPALCLHAQFRARAARTPEAVAVVGEDATLTYAELDRRSDALAWHLRGLGVGPEVRVGLSVERSAELVVGMLGILKAGGAYVPLDPDYPRERLSYMLEDSGATVLLTQSHLAGALPSAGLRTVLLDAPEAYAAGHDGPPAPGTTPDSVAYVIYTSGSTGRPKGVMVPHGGVANFFTAMDARVGNEPVGTWLAVTSISFDISVLELLWTLTRGFKVVVQGEGAVLKAPARAASPRTRPMDFSLFYFADDADDAGGDRYRLLLEGAKFADTHGFAAVWTPERHFHAFGGLYPNPSVAGAAIAAVTKRVAIRAGSVVLPLHHPVRVAEEWSLVDNLSRGRVGISVASGWHANDFVFAPEKYEQRRELMLEGVHTLRKLWRGETVRFAGGAGAQVDVKLRPRPVQAELPVWLTAAGNPETFVTAGRMGCHVLTHLLGQTWEDLEKKLALYREAWRAAGHPGEGHVTLMLHTFIGEDAAKVRAVVEQPFRDYLKSSADLMRGLGRTLGIDMDAATEADLDRLAGHAFERYFETSGLFGTPRSVRERVERLRALGVDEVGCLIDFGIPADTVLASLPLLHEVKQRSDRDNHRTGTARSIPENLREHAVTHLQCTPSLARALLAEPASAEALGGLRRMMVGGEALPGALATSLRQALPESAALLNMYGPTETTIWSSTFRVDGEAAAVVPIGTPLTRTQLYVLDARLRPVPVGVPGELYIGGAGVVRGYLKRPELTAERFIPDPHGREPGARLYRTGDRARWRADGTVEFLGRVDHQLKVRGFRIEAGEVEAALTAQPSVREAVVVAREDVPGDVRLVAYVVARPGQAVEPSALRDALAQRLPEHMVPSLVVDLPALPLTPNGKVDRKALPAPTVARSAKAAYVAPQGQLEEQIAEVWRKVLRVEQVGVHDNFFDLGGHSLLMVQAHAQLKAVLGQELPLLKLLEHPTISALARFARQEPASTQSSVEAAQDRAKRQLESLKRQRQRARK